MTITITSTTKIIEVNGVPVRVWEGHTTDSGIEVHCFITRVAVSGAHELDVFKQFEKELKEVKAPSAEIESYSLKMIL